MPDHTDMPPVLRTLGDDLFAAMTAAAASRRRIRRRPAVIHGWTAKRWATAAVVALGAITAALVLGTTGGGPPNAFADWTPAATPPTIAQLQAAEAACGQQSPDLASLTPAISDFRGQNALLIYAGSATTTMCDNGSTPFGTSVSVWTADSSPVAAGAVVLEASGLSVTQTGQEYLKLAGRVGAGVSAVTLTIADGDTVSATVANGWFAAWWPESLSGGQPGQGGPVGHAVAQSIQITTANGTTTTQPLDMQDVPAPVSIDGFSMHPCAQLPATCGASSASGPSSAGVG